MREVNFWWIKG